jgi:hypothetical protein
MNKGATGQVTTNIEASPEALYDLVSNGTVVTESFELVTDMPWYFRMSDRFLMGVKDRHADLEKNMTETLQRLKTASENQAPRHRSS